MGYIKIDDGVYMIRIKNNTGNNPKDWVRIPDELYSWIQTLAQEVDSQKHEEVSRWAGR